MRCSRCVLKDRCLLRRVARKARGPLGPVITETPLYDRGSQLFIQGKSFGALYVVRAGSVKTTFAAGSSLARVSGFSFPGDALGVDAAANRRHHSSAVLLEHSTFCRVTPGALDGLLRACPQVYEELLAWHNEIILRDQRLLATLVKFRSEYRLADFLMYLRQQQASDSVPAARIVLPMTRMDIASYLKMRVETVSRALGKLAAGCVVRVHSGWIEVSDEAALKRIAAGATSRCVNGR